MSLIVKAVTALTMLSVATAHAAPVTDEEMFKSLPEGAEESLCTADEPTSSCMDQEVRSSDHVTCTRTRWTYYFQPELNHTTYTCSLNKDEEPK